MWNYDDEFFEDESGTVNLSDIFAAYERTPAGRCFRRCRDVLNDMNDDDSHLLRAADAVAERLHLHAHEQKIDLYQGESWIDPGMLFPHAAQLIEVFNELRFSVNYKNWQAARTAELAATIAATAPLREKIAAWPAMTHSERRSTAQELSQLQLAVFCRDTMPAPSIKNHFYFAAAPRCEDPYYVRGTHRSPPMPYDGAREPHVITYNAHHESGFRIAAVAMDVIHHENTHALQHTLAAAYANDNMAEDHPLRREARLFAGLETLRGTYIARVKPAYRAHPLEQDAFAQGARFTTALRTALQPYGIDIDSPPPARRSRIPGGPA